MATIMFSRHPNFIRIFFLLLFSTSLSKIAAQESADLNVDDAIGVNTMSQLEEEDDLQKKAKVEEAKAAVAAAIAEALAKAEDAQLPQEIEDMDPGEEKKKYGQKVEIDETVERNRMHEGEYAHPFHRPNIAEDVMYTYRRFRRMKLIYHGAFWMGTNDPRSETGEYPVREVPVRSFYFDIFPIINAFYWAFRAKKKFVRSEAEQRGWSWVTEDAVSEETAEHYSTEGPKGWLAVKGARWDRPEGPDSDLEDRWTYPVVHLSWDDARRFCEFHGNRLPTEQEWEYAARAGLVAEDYPWGDRWERRRANLFQGRWPDGNTLADGYRATSPVDAFGPQNQIGLYDLMGNVWEWTHSRYYERLISRHLQSQMYVLKGGSFVDSVDGDINLAVRNGQRSGQPPEYTASNVGFRCARSAPHLTPTIKKRTTVAPPKPQNPKVPKIYRKPKPNKTGKDEL